MRLHPLGYPLDITANSEKVLSAAAESWSAWPALFDAAPVRLHVDVHAVPAPPGVPTFVAPPGWLKFFIDEDNFAAFELESRTGYMSISGAALGHKVWFRHHWLEAVVLTALDSIFFTPLHAACVARNGVGTLLCGDSGAGKSSLSYACAKHGWTLVSDDAVHLAPGPERIGVGGSNVIHLREPARDLFPELDLFHTAPAPNGKQAIEVDAAAHGFSTARHVTASRVFFLKRRPGPPALDSFPVCAAVHYFLKYLEPRDTTAAERHLRDFLSPEPLLLGYDRIEDAVKMIESFEGAHS